MRRLRKRGNAVGVVDASEAAGGDRVDAALGLISTQAPAAGDGPGAVRTVASFDTEPARRRVERGDSTPPKGGKLMNATFVMDDELTSSMGGVEDGPSTPADTSQSP